MCAAIDTRGKMVAELTIDKAITIDSFKDFLGRLHSHTRGARSVLMVDNLAIHHNREVKLLADWYNIELCFNGTYSSEFMPIERLWAWAKSAFTK